uniref:Sulfatase domain-containing protein n=1 Tax=Rhabditophanes sp. KR3021 TaxID=114890 RepID=A0AC35UFA2_9BILA
MSHGHLNDISAMDEVCLTFLKENVAIIFSDHGNRYDALRDTLTGRYETRLPFLAVKLSASSDQKARECPLGPSFGRQINFQHCHCFLQINVENERT